MAVYRCRKRDESWSTFEDPMKLNDHKNDNEDNGGCWVDDEMEVARHDGAAVGGQLGYT